MNDSALFLMMLAQGFVTIMTIYFFAKVLRMPPKKEDHSYED